MSQYAELQKKVNQNQVDQEVASMFFWTELCFLKTQAAQRQTEIPLRISSVEISACPQMSPGTSHITQLMLCMAGSLCLYYFFPPKSESSCPNHRDFATSWKISILNNKYLRQPKLFTLITQRGHKGFYQGTLELGSLLKNFELFTPTFSQERWNCVRNHKSD